MEIIYVVFLTFFSALFAVSTDVDISILWFDPSKFVAYILGIPQKKNIEIEDEQELVCRAGGDALVQPSTLHRNARGRSGLAQRRDGYAAYVARTSTFVPRPPKVEIDA